MGVGPLALDAVMTIAQALVRVEAGQLGVLTFGGARPEVLRPLGAAPPVFGLNEALPILSKLTFGEECADAHHRGLADLLTLASDTFEGQRIPGGPACSQMVLILTDGRFNKGVVRPLVQAALSRGQVPVLIIVDGQTDKSSVYNLKTVSYDTGNPVVQPYLDDFPFQYYAVVQDIQALPAILPDIIRQWFDLFAV